MTDSTVWRSGRRNRRRGRSGSLRAANSDATHEGDAGVVEVGFEGFAAVAVVGDEGLAGPRDGCLVDHVCATAALVGFGAGEREGDRQPCGGDDEVQAKPPEPARMGSAPAVLGPSRESGAPHGGPACAARHRRGVGQPHVVVPVAGQRAGHMADHLPRPAQPLVAAVVVGQVREPRPQTLAGEAHEPALALMAQQRRDHRHGGQLRVEQLRGDPRPGPPRCQSHSMGPKAKRLSQALLPSSSPVAVLSSVNSGPVRSAHQPFVSFGEMSFTNCGFFLSGRPKITQLTPPLCLVDG